MNIRISTEDSHNNFKHKLKNLDWSIINHSKDINPMYTRVIRTVKDLYDEAFPVNNKTITVSDKCRPWISVHSVNLK